MWLVVPEGEKERAEFYAERKRLSEESLKNIKRCSSDSDSDIDDDTVYEPLDPKDVGFKPANYLCSLPSNCFVSLEFDEFAEDGLDFFKKKHPESDYQFSEVLEVNIIEGAGLYFYVTFEATDASGSRETFQMCGSKYPGPRTSNKVDMCRLKEPRQEENSSEEVSNNYSVLGTRKEENSSEEISDNDNMLEIRLVENSSEEISDNDNMLEIRLENSSEEISDNENMLETSYDDQGSRFDVSGAIPV